MGVAAHGRFSTMQSKEKRIVAAATISVVAALLSTSVAGVASAQDAQPGTPTLQQISSEHAQATSRHGLAPAIVAAASIANSNKVAREKATAVVVTAGPNDGVIALTQRACGASHGWNTVAAANNISAPVYLVLTGQQLTVNCVTAANAPADVYPVTQPVQRQTTSASSPAPAPAPQPAPAVNGNWTAPLVGKCYTSQFGWRGGRIHEGIDIPTGVGTNVHAVGSGTVHWGNDPDGAGWYIMLDHGNGLWTAYFHLSNRLVGDGAWVNVGDVIAKSGGARGAAGAGNSQGPHLHFEVHPWGEWTKHWNDALGANAYQNPAQWLGWVGAPIGRC